MLRNRFICMKQLPNGIIYERHSGTLVSLTKSDSKKTKALDWKNFFLLFTVLPLSSVLHCLSCPRYQASMLFYYSPSILDKAGFSLGEALGGQVTIGLVNVVFTFVAIFTVDKWGRHPLLILSITLAVLSLAIIGVVLYECNRRPVDTDLHPSFYFQFCIFVRACFLYYYQWNFSYSYSGRLFRWVSYPIWIANFFVGQMTPVMLKSASWGPTGTFWTFAILCAPTLYLTLKMIPKTKGKSLEQIEEFGQAKSLSTVDKKQI